jgi:hypothetical protein
MLTELCSTISISLFRRWETSNKNGGQLLGQFVQLLFATSVVVWFKYSNMHLEREHDISNISASKEGNAIYVTFIKLKTNCVGERALKWAKTQSRKQ